MVIGMVLAGGLGKRMGGDKPKVLYEVRGVPMVVRAVNALRDGGVSKLVAILSHRSDEVASVLSDDVEVVVQTECRGTASAIIAAEKYLEDDDATIVVSFGDMPWLNPHSVAGLVKSIEDGAAAAVLTYVFDDPPHFGRVLRGDDGKFVGLRQYKDCSASEKALNECDAGMFAFRAKPLREVLSKLDSNNAAGEIYLTDAPAKIVEAGLEVVCVGAQNIEEALGVNDPRHLRFAELLPDIRDAEQEVPKADLLYREAVSQDSWPPMHRDDWASKR